MDAFYASVEQRDNPSLRGKPVAVGGSSSGRGVVSAASYEARRYGVRSAMSGHRAKTLCPDLIFVRTRMQRYAEISKAIREIFLRFTPIIQPLSLDEAFLDVTETVHLFQDAETIGKSIQAAIREELDLPCSVGIAPLKFVAKIASDLEKPNGFVFVGVGSVQAFLDPLPVERMWGVGGVAIRKLHAMNCKTIADLRRLPESVLSAKFGKWGTHIWRLANAIDPRGVVTDRNAKQISHERTFHEDISNDEILFAVAAHLAELAARRLRQSNRRCRSVQVKYRLSDFKTLSRQHSLPIASQSTQEITEIARKLLATLRCQFPQPVRLVGVGVSELTDTSSPLQLELLDQEETAKQKVLDQLSDLANQKFGGPRLYRANAHRWNHATKHSSTGDSNNANRKDR